MCKIAIIDHVGNKAGMDYYSSALAKGFVNQKCSCTVYSNFIGIESDRINYKMYYEGHSKTNQFLKLFRFLIATIKSSYQARKEKTDLVVLHLFYSNIITLILVFLPRLFGLKTLVVAHDISSFVDNDNQLIQNLIYNKFSNNIVVHNKFSYATLINSIKVENPEKIKIIKHGGYIDHIQNSTTKENARKQLGLDEHQKYILFFGQIKKVKGLDILLKAMPSVDTDINLIIAGKPLQSDMQFYYEIIDKLKLENRVVKIIRFIEDSERENLFFASDLNVLPYRIIYQSGVLLMAMSHGLPVIASDLPANKEIITDEDNGLLFENENTHDLADKINNFFKNDDLKNRLVLNSIKTIEKLYNWDDIAKSYIDIVKK